MTKRCIRCELDYPIEEFYRTGESRNVCRNCRNKQDAERFRKNYRTDKGFRDEHNRKRVERLRKNRDKSRALSASSYQKGRDSLSDSYVSGLIARKLGIPRAAVPSEMIEAHRVYLQLLREIEKTTN